MKTRKELYKVEMEDTGSSLIITFHDVVNGVEYETNGIKIPYKTVGDSCYMKISEDTKEELLFRINHKFRYEMPK